MAPPGIKRMVSHDEIIKSAQDKRLYRGLELTNGLRVMLVSDPTTDKSSAAMDVHIGLCFTFISHIRLYIAVKYLTLLFIISAKITRKWVILYNTGCFHVLDYTGHWCNSV